MDLVEQAGLFEQVCDGNEARSTRELEVLKVNGWAPVELTVNPMMLTTNLNCSTARQSSSHGSTWCRWHGSKTVDNVTVHAFRYSIMGDMRWKVEIDVNGRSIALPTEIDAGFADLVSVSQVDGFDTTATYKAFDIWKEGGSVYVSCLGDVEEVLWIINVAEKTYQGIDVGIRSWWQRGDYDEALRHIRLLGLKERTAFYSYTQIHYSRMQSFNQIYEVDMSGGSPSYSTTDLKGRFAIYDEFSESLYYYAWEEDCSLVNEDWICCAMMKNCESCTFQGIYCTYYPCGATASCGYWDGGMANWIDGGFEVLYDTDRGCSCDNLSMCYTKVRYHYLGGSSRTDCLQTGGGERRFAEDNVVICQADIKHACNQDNPACSSYGRDDYGCTDYPWCTQWTNWEEDFTTLEASVHKSGVGFKGQMTLINGRKCANDYELGYSEEVVEQDYGSFIENYAVDAFPYYRNFAILKTARDAQGTTYTDIEALKGDNGINVAGNVYSGAHFFFVR